MKNIFSGFLVLVISFIFFISSLAKDQNIDKPGAIKHWGAIDVTLKSFNFQGKHFTGVLVLRNTRDKEEIISSMLDLQVTNEEGDKGKTDWDQTEARCDGTIPPKGVFKCTFGYDFSEPPNQVTIRVGLDKGAYFIVKKKPADKE